MEAEYNTDSQAFLKRPPMNGTHYPYAIPEKALITHHTKLKPSARSDS